LFHCKMRWVFLVNTHVFKMIVYIEKLDQIGFVIDHKLSVDLVLQSLLQSFSQFIMNYRMNKLDSTLPKLLNMLKTAKGALKKEENSILLVHSFWMSKKKDKKNKCVVSKANKPTDGIKKDKGTCHHCGKEGYWRRNCKEYLATVKTMKLVL